MTRNHFASTATTCSIVADDTENIIDTASELIATLPVGRTSTIGRDDSDARAHGEGEHAGKNEYQGTGHARHRVQPPPIS